MVEMERDRVQETYRILGDCFPTGDYRDSVGGTAKQLLYIRDLSGMDAEEFRSFLNVMIIGGGLSLTQCGSLIAGLKERKRSAV